MGTTTGTLSRVRLEPSTPPTIMLINSSFPVITLIHLSFTIACYPVKFLKMSCVFGGELKTAIEDAGYKLSESQLLDIFEAQRSSVSLPILKRIPILSLCA